MRPNTTMTLRNGITGADAQSRNNLEIRRNNHPVRPQETEYRRRFPALEPGRALLDLESGTIYEVMHTINGATETAEKRKSSWEEKMDYKYDDRTPEGQDYGGIIQHFFISVAERQSPLPNRHGEIQVPINRPEEYEITDLRPQDFESKVLFGDNGRARPLLLLERPSVTYEEVIPGETFDIVGRFDPTEDRGDRIKNYETVANQFPEIADVEITAKTVATLDEHGVTLEGLDSGNAVKFDNEDGSLTAEVTDDTEDFHISYTPNDIPGMENSAVVSGSLIIDCPFDANDDAKAPDFRSIEFDYDAEGYKTPASRNTVNDMIRTYTDLGHTITMDTSIIERLASTREEMVPVEETTVSKEEIIEYTFSEEVTEKREIELKTLDVTIDTDGITDDTIVVFGADEDGNITTETTDSAADAHITAVVGDTIRFDADKDQRDLITALDWNEHQYGWDDSDEFWKVNDSGVAPLIRNFTEDGENISAPVSVLTRLGTERTVTSTRLVEGDQDALTGVDGYESTDFPDVFDYTGLEVDVSSEDSDEYVEGITVTQPKEAMSLMNLDMNISDSNVEMNVTPFMDIADLPKKTSSSWKPTTTGEDEYTWVKPETNERIVVRETEGWGTEYELLVQETKMEEPREVVTLADEQMIVQQAILHMKAM